MIFKSEKYTIDKDLILHADKKYQCKKERGRYYIIAGSFRSGETNAMGGAELSIGITLDDQSIDDALRFINKK